MSDQWIKCLAHRGNLIATAIDARHLVEEARKRHSLNEAATIALGETLIAGLLLVSNCKTGERLSITVKGSHLLKYAIADANPDGSVRGYIVLRKAEEMPESISHNASLGPWQEGMLSVVRLKDQTKEPYVGTVPNITGHLSKDLVFYLSQSEQIPSAVGLAVGVDQNGKVNSAGGFLLQVLPGASKAEVLMVENNIAELQNLTQKLASDPNPTKLLGQVFSDLSFTLLEEKPLQFSCNCSRQRVLRALKMVGTKELESMITEDHQAEVLCDFCSKKFLIEEKELHALLEELKK